MNDRMVGDHAKRHELNFEWQAYWESYKRWHYRKWYWWIEMYKKQTFTCTSHHMHTFVQHMLTLVTHLHLYSTCFHLYNMLTYVEHMLT